MKSQLKFKKYKASKYFQLYRNTIPEGVNESDWLRCALQPFDTIIEYTDDAKKAMFSDSMPNKNFGPYVKDMYTACPICGCREVYTEKFNELEPEALAGSAGFNMICKECGYKHRVVTMMS